MASSRPIAMSTPISHADKDPTAKGEMSKKGSRLATDPRPNVLGSTMNDQACFSVLTPDDSIDGVPTGVMSDKVLSMSESTFSNNRNGRQ